MMAIARNEQQRRKRKLNAEPQPLNQPRKAGDDGLDIRRAGHPTLGGPFRGPVLLRPHDGTKRILPSALLLPIRLPDLLLRHLLCRPWPLLGLGLGMARRLLARLLASRWLLQRRRGDPEAEIRKGRGHQRPVRPDDERPARARPLGLSPRFFSFAPGNGQAKFISI